MCILFVCYGEILWNVEGCYQGQIDILLLLIGEVQVQVLGECLVLVDIICVVVLLLLCVQCIVQFVLGSVCVDMLFIELDLQEIVYGEWEGLLVSEINDKDLLWLKVWCEELDIVLMLGGELLCLVLECSWCGLVCVVDGFGEYDILLVVVYDVVNCVILCCIFGLLFFCLWIFCQVLIIFNLFEGFDLDSLEVVCLNDCVYYMLFFGEVKYCVL